MGALLAAGRRFTSSVFLFALITTGTRVGSFLQYWSATWWNNRSQIIVTTAVNVGLTTFNEAVCRTLLAKVTHTKAKTGFFVLNNRNQWQVNWQSLVNILMTLFASLIGGPVYFFRRKASRFWFFIGFGCFNSLISQEISCFIRNETFYQGVHRLAFDLIYTGTVRFGMFELFRGPIVRAASAFFEIGAWRMFQDFLTTLFRVGLLNSFGFMG